MDIVRGHGHHLLIQRQLHTHQVLRETLSPFPTEHGQWHQHLSRHRITGQTFTLSASMNQDTFFLREPLLKRLLPSFSPYSFSPCFLQQPRSSPSASETMTDGVTRTEVVLPAQSRHIVKGIYQIRWQRQQFLHLLTSSRSLSLSKGTFFFSIPYILRPRAQESAHHKPDRQRSP